MPPAVAPAPPPPLMGLPRHVLPRFCVLARAGLRPARRTHSPSACARVCTLAIASSARPLAAAAYDQIDVIITEICTRNLHAVVPKRQQPLAAKRGGRQTSSERCAAPLSGWSRRAGGAPAGCPDKVGGKGAGSVWLCFPPGAAYRGAGPPAAGGLGSCLTHAT